MLSDEAIAQVNANLDLCDTYLLNQHEIDLLNAKGDDPSDVCGYWDTTQDVLSARALTDPTMQSSLDVMITLSNIDSCPLTLAPEVVIDVDIPYFGGGL